MQWILFSPKSYIIRATHLCKVHVHFSEITEVAASDQQRWV